MRTPAARAPHRAILSIPIPALAVGGLAVEVFLNGDVRHGRRWRGALPMLLSRRIQTMFSGRISSVRPPQRFTRPQPAVTIKVWGACAMLSERRARTSRWH